MRILVYPHDLGMGGSQTNAIEIAAATRDLGHDVIVYGQPGILLSRIAELGLEFVASPDLRRRPSASVVADLRRVARERRVDILHGYEWPPILESRLACVGSRSAVVGTVMSMAVAPFIPYGVPLVVGTEQIAALERGRGRTCVDVIEPPVDVAHNAPDVVVDVEAFRRAYGVPDARVHVVCVSRLARELKLEGLLTAIDTVPDLGTDVVLTIVGGGAAEAEVRQAADRANARHSRRAVVLTGEVLDPRPAYAMADIVLGMGGSALRALAFAKPLVVQGEQGFWQALSQATLPQFEWTGWYGVGPGPDAGPGVLHDALSPWLHDEVARRAAGDDNRRLVVDRYSIAAAAERQVGLYLRARAEGAGRRIDPLNDLTGAGVFVGHTARRMARRRLGRVSTDDFNARPVAAGQMRRPAP